MSPSLAGKIEGELNDDPTSFIPSNEMSVTFEFKLVTEQCVLTAIRGLKDSKSPGPDRFPAKILNDAEELTSNPLKTIFNESLKVGVFPDIWKAARVKPISKSGRHSDLNNYRPISVLSAVSRKFEKVARDQLFEFLTANNLLSKNQFAYRKLHSTITSLLNVTDFWYSNVDQKNINISPFLDFRKALDTIDHDVLLAKLKKYGICQKELAWFASYLTGRQQYCYHNGRNLKKRLVTCGIPQGSCLGPLLIILYTNEFEESLTKFTPNMYADDTSLTLGGEDAHQLLEDLRNELQDVKDWLRQNKFSLNVTKCEKNSCLAFSKNFHKRVLKFYGTSQGRKQSQTVAWQS